MKETRAVLTDHSLERRLDELGVERGGLLVVHASLSALGYVLHGAGAVLAALRRTIGPDGTLLVPTFTGERIDPSCWVDPALPPSIWTEVRDRMPAFDKERTLPRLMGELSLAVLLDPDAVRSDHPVCSWAALGPRADELVRNHDLLDPFGEGSPLGHAYREDAQVLLLGVDQRRNSAFLHAHVRSDVPQVRRNLGPFLAEVAGERQWVTPERFVHCTEGYSRLEDELVSSGLLRTVRIGDSDCRLVQMRRFVDAVEHMIRTQPERVFCSSPSCGQCRA